MVSRPSAIGRYEIKSPIGRGGMGSLYLAHDPNTNRFVAIKLLDASLNTPEFRERFVREARALAAVNHPNIVAIYDTGEFEGAPYIVMEYVRGETLAEIIARRASIPMGQRIKWMAELCAGLGQAHDARVIHRDIKPANLIIDQQERLKILDFGIARVDMSATTVDLPLTQVNVAIGTPGYMSPEQLEGGVVDHRSDLFAVGAVCYELFTYVEAFAGGNTAQTQHSVATTQPRKLTDVVSGLDPEFDDVVLRALRKDPHRRYQDASSFERALTRLRARVEGNSVPVVPPATPPPGSSTRHKAREVRAEASFQRALAAHQSGAIEVARRFAVEALAEDPSHKEARALLAGFDPPPARRVAPTAVPAPSLATAVSTSIEPTMILDPADTRAATDSYTVPHDANTIIVQPSKRPASERAASTRAMPARGPAQSSALKSHIGRLRAGLLAWAARAGVRAGSLRGYKSGALLVAAAVALVLTTVFIVRAAPDWFASSGYVLTITKPENGTLVSAAGIQCGIGGDDCETTLKKDEAVELIAQPAPGHVLVAYTGDCAPMGRVTMMAARTCSARFEATSAPTVESVSGVTMTIELPVGGTLEGVEIICGTKGTKCTATYPLNETMRFLPIADEGYTFMAFTGDCAATGQTHMSVDRTCGATFKKTSELVVTAPPPRPRPEVQAAAKPELRATAEGRGGDVRPENPATSKGRGENVPTPPPVPTAASPPVVDQPPQPPPPDSKPPETAESFDKRQIGEVLAKWCEAYIAIDPEAVRRVYPSADMTALRLQLNKRMYRSVQCTTGDPKYASYDAAGGTAVLQADVTWKFEHTVPKTEESKLIGTFRLAKAEARTVWHIQKVEYRRK